MKKTIKLSESELINVIKKIIKEQTNQTQCTEEEFIRMEKEFDVALISVGIKLTDEEKSEIQPNCPIESDIPSNITEEQKNLIYKVFSKMGKMNKEELKNALKELVGIQRKIDKVPQNQTIVEQKISPTLTILGIGAAAWLLSGPVIAFIIVGGIIMLGRLIFRGSCAERGGRKSGCNRRKGLGHRRKY